MAEKTLLVADADLGVCEALRAYFEAVGFAVVTAQDGAQCVSVFKSIEPAALLLRAPLPVKDGMQVLSELRRESDAPILMMAGENDTFDAVTALEEGADDVLTIPFDLPLVAARVKAILRRVQQSSERAVNDVIRYDNFEISRERFELKLGGAKVEIPPKELQLLYCLAANPNRVFSREQLLEHVWDFAFLGDSRTVDVHIKRLREKLKGVSEKWALSTVWGIGYKFELK
ncbi:MAG: response regulator transcription factor [Clostridia bacterium]|nr:response regulator transcription factor [Clostridia bacterium]